MVWIVEFSEDAFETLSKLDRKVQQRIVSYMDERVVPSRNPRTLAKPLQGRHRGYWRFRVGDYRLICDIVDDRLIVRVITLDHRSRVYR